MTVTSRLILALANLCAAAIVLGVDATALAGVTSLAVAETGTIVAGNTDDGARVWLRASTSPARILRHRGDVTAVAISEDGRRIVTGSADETAIVWDAATGTALRTLPVDTAVSAVACSADGRNVVTGSTAGQVQIWDAESGALLRTFMPSKPQQAFAVALSPAGDTIAGGYKFETLLWNATTGAIVKNIRHGGRSIAFVPGSSEIMLLAGWSAVLFVDPGSDRAARRLPDNRSSGFIVSLALSADGGLAATGRAEENKAEVWDTTPERESPPLLVLSEAGTVNAIAFSADGREIVTGSADGTVEIWDLASGKAKRLSN